jgi:hypothetical protein
MTIAKRIHRLESSIKPKEENIIVLISKGKVVRPREEFKTMGDYVEYLDSHGIRYVRF